MDFKYIYTVQKVTDTFVLISDNNNGLSITNAARNIVPELNNVLEDGLGLRRIYYRDSVRRQNQVDRWPPDLRDGLVHHVGC